MSGLLSQYSRNFTNNIVSSSDANFLFPSPHKHVGPTASLETQPFIWKIHMYTHNNLLFITYMTYWVGTLIFFLDLLQPVLFSLYGNQYEAREEHLLLTMFQVWTTDNWKVMSQQDNAVALVGFALLEGLCHAVNST